jgi:hypothetical protein
MINVKAAEAEIRENRLNSIYAYQGTAKKLCQEAAKGLLFRFQPFEMLLLSIMDRFAKPKFPYTNWWYEQDPFLFAGGKTDEQFY